MSDNNKVLLLSDRPGIEPLEPLLSACKLTVRAFSDFSEAMDEIETGAFAVIIISSSRPDLAHLCREARKLKPDVKLVVVCDGQDEPDFRAMTGFAIDEYFIHPVSEQDAATIIARVNQPNPNQLPTTALPVEEFANLLTEARTLPLLEQYLARRTALLTGTAVSWVPSRDAADELLQLDINQGLSLQADEPFELNRECESFLAAMKACLPAIVTSLKRCETLHRLAITDHLTGAFNRRYFYHATERILKKAETGDARVTLLLFDIDNFKRYNDTFGHATGDAILREVAEMMKKITRSHDIVARIGGDEFAVLFWDENPPRTQDSTPPSQTHELASRFRSAIEGREFTMLGTSGSGSLTISGGLATFPIHGRTCRDLLSQADSALRGAKSSGKNSICLIGQNGEYISDRPNQTPYGNQVEKNR